MKRTISSTLVLAACACAVLLMNPAEALACRTMVGDFVWLDGNGNGIQDPGEPGINGVTVNITGDQTNFPRSVVTANRPGTSDAGYYSFNIQCDWQYTISIDASTAPAGHATSPIGAGSNVAVDSDNHAGTVFSVPMVIIGQDPPPNLTIDFGYVPPCTGSIGDFVWSDDNNNGIQDPGEPAIAGAVMTLNGSAPTATDANGNYSYGGLCGGTYTVCVQIPPGSQPSPALQGLNAAIDSNGVSNGAGGSCATVTLPGGNSSDITIDFGLFDPPDQDDPGTGTPGYWKNHPEAWPVSSITVGGVVFTKEQAIAWMKAPDSKDKTLTIFSSLVAAKLNGLIGNEDECVAGTIVSADAWLASYPVGSGVKASSLAWKTGEPLHRTLDNYNNGMLCAPARD